MPVSRPLLVLTLSLVASAARADSPEGIAHVNGLMLGVLATPHLAPASDAPPAATDAPAHLAIVQAKLGLAAADLERLKAERFIIPEGPRRPNYEQAIRWLWANDVPLYVSVDAGFYALHRTAEEALARLEEDRIPAFANAIIALHERLSRVHRELPAAVGRDLDLYLGVARALMEGHVPPSAIGDRRVTAKVKTLSERIERAQGQVEIELGGSTQTVDLRLFQPRGRHGRFAKRWVEDPVATGPFQRVDDYVVESWRYFQAATWLSRVGLGAPAFQALASFVAGSDEARAGLGPIEAIWDLSGPRKVLPPRAPRSLLGARTTRDTNALERMFDPGLPSPGLADLAYVLGHDAARAWLSPARLRGIDVLERARAELAAPDSSLYGATLDGILAIARRPSGILPSYFDGAAAAAHRAESALAAYAMLRNDHALAVDVPMEAGCSMPDAWVDPQPEVWHALARGAERLAAVTGDPTIARQVIIYRTLARIATHELTGHPLTPLMREFLATATAVQRPWVSEGAVYSVMRNRGWYDDLLPQDELVRLLQNPVAVDRGLGLAVSAVVAVHRDGAVLHAAAMPPRFAVVLVDRGGGPRVVAGPVATAFEVVADHVVQGHELADAVQEGARVRRPWAPEVRGLGADAEVFDDDSCHQYPK